MSAKKIAAIALLLLGFVFLTAGVVQYRKSRMPNTCIVSFSKSLGGQASLAFEKSVQRRRDYGLAGMSLGIVFVFAGSSLYFRSKE